VSIQWHQRLRPIGRMSGGAVDAAITISKNRGGQRLGM